MRSLVLGLVVASSLSFADCKLNRRLPLGSHDLMATPLTLYRVVFDQTPAFTRPEKYDPAKDALLMNLFNIEWNESPTGYLGLSVWVHNKNERVGFSGIYKGGFAFTGSKETVQGVTTFRTNETNKPLGAHHAAGNATTETIVKVEKDDILSVELRFPIYKVHQSFPSGDVLAFTGKHQQLCLLEADLKP